MIEFKLPDLGEGVAEGQIVSVLVKEGDTVEEFQPMLEVETDKAAVEIPAPTAGTVSKLHVEAGQTVKVGAVLVSIDENGASGAAAPAKQEAPAEKPAPAPKKAADPTPPAPEPAKPAAPAGGPVPAAPSVRKLAREMNVDLAAVTATGPRGRVLREDVERTALSRDGGVLPAPTGAATPTPELPDFSQYGPVRREPAPQIRKTIARQMNIAWTNVPRVTQTDSADITDLERSRKEYNATLKEGDTKLTVTAVVLKAVAAALRKHPQLNCSYDGAAGEIIYKDYVNIGLATDTPRGLIVPVLRDVDKKPAPQIAAEMNDLIARVRGGKFDIAELRGATFSLTNLGPIGGEFFTPMVNYPEVAILGLGRAKLQPAVHDGQITPRLILPLSISYDHRIVDGADGARFMTDVVQALANPLRLIAML